MNKVAVAERVDGRQTERKDKEKTEGGLWKEQRGGSAAKPGTLAKMRF